MSWDERLAGYLETGHWDPAWGPVPSRLAAARRQLTDRDTWAAPPAGADAVVAAIERELEDERDRAGGEGRPRRRGGRRLPWLVAALTAAVVAAAVGITIGGDEGPRGQSFVLAGTELAPGARAEGEVWSTGAGEWFRLELDGLPPAAPGTYYHGWVHGQTGVVSLGTFHARDDRDPVHLWSGVDVEAFPWITITVQRVGEADRGPVVLEGLVPTGAQDEADTDAAAR